MDINKKLFPMPYYVYVAKYVKRRQPDGTVRRHYFALEKQCGSYPDYSQASVRVDAIKKDIRDIDGVEVFSSRQKGYCEDVMRCPIRDKQFMDSIPPDVDVPGCMYIAVIATFFSLELAGGK